MAREKCSRCGQVVVCGDNGAWLCPHCGEEINVDGRNSVRWVIFFIKWGIKLAWLFFLPFTGIVEIIRAFMCGEKKTGIFFIVMTVLGWVFLLLINVTEVSIYIYFSLIVVYGIAKFLIKKQRQADSDGEYETESDC